MNQRLEAFLEELRALAQQDSPERAAVDRAFAAAAAIMKAEPHGAPIILRKSLPLIMHAREHVARGAAEGTLKLLDLAAALPHDVVDECMPVLAQLLDFSIGKWSFSQSTYRFARFAPLRRRILDHALEMAVAERNHTNPFVAVMALQDVVTGLQKCGAFDEPHVDEAFARFVIGQSSADVKKALVAYLLESAPAVVGRILDVHPELFPSVEDLHVYQSEQRGHLTELGPHEKRIAGLGRVPIAEIERWLHEPSDVGRRMAAALAVAHLPDTEARRRLAPLLRAMLDDEESKHVASVEQQPPAHFWLRTVALRPLTKIVSELRDPALALDALKASTARSVAATLLPLARACAPGDAAQWLASVVQRPDDDAMFAFAVAQPESSAAAIKWVAFETLCALVTSVDDDVAGKHTLLEHALRAATHIVDDINASTPADRRIVSGLWARLAPFADRFGARPLLPLLQAWPATLAWVDGSHWLRFGSYNDLKKLKRHTDAVAPFLAEAKRVLLETAKSDKLLAEALLIQSP